jgi:predicted TIM-barrel enzyme
MRSYTRAEVLKRLQKRLDSGHLILATGAGTGISAKFEEQGGTDLILAFNSGRYRMDGLGSLAGLMAYGDANAIALEMGERHILPIVKETPVICSVNGTDPTRVKDRFLAQVMAAGFSGVNNFPTVGLIDGRFREALEQTGLGYDKEVELIATARARDIFTMAYVFNTDEAKRMVEAGCDALIVHFGLTVGGSIGARDSVSVEEAALLTKAVSEEQRKAGSTAFLLVHGGPIESAADVKKLLAMIRFDGFVGASSIERVPVEPAISEATASFGQIGVVNPRS